MVTSIHTHLLAALALAALGGCATTTGDPRQGGLFGWNEDQAKVRQQELWQAEQGAQQLVASEQLRTALLDQQRAARATDADRLRRELDRLMDENGKLDAQLRELMQRHQISKDDVQRLRKMLTDNERLRGNAAQGPQDGALAGAIRPAEAVSEQNSRLHREVMILLRR